MDRGYGLVDTASTSSKTTPVWYQSFK